MLHIVQYSGGLASALVAQIILERYGHKKTILMNHNTFTEHLDTQTFKEDVYKGDYI